MSSLSPHLIWSKDHIRCVSTFSKDCQGRIITHAFTIALHSFLSCTIILPCSTNIPLSFNALFTPSIHRVQGLPLTSDPTILYANQSSSILSMCLNHLNTLCSAQPANSRNTSFLSHLISHSIYTRYSIIIIIIIFIFIYIPGYYPPKGGYQWQGTLIHIHINSSHSAPYYPTEENYIPPKYSAH